MKILGMLRPGRRPHAALLQLWQDTVALWRGAKLENWMVRDISTPDRRQRLQREWLASARAVVHGEKNTVRSPSHDREVMVLLKLDGRA